MIVLLLSPSTNTLFVTSSVRGRTNRIIYKEKEPVLTEFDEDGGIQDISTVYAAIEKSPRALVMSIENGTLLSYNIPSTYSSLQVSYGGSPLTMLSNPSQYMLITGIGGDCRYITRKVKQIALNHTMSFDCEPTALYIAKKVSNILQYSTMTSGSRLFATHIFICDQRDKKIFEIDAIGNIAELNAGVSGHSMVKYNQLLQESYKHNLPLQEAENIARDILKMKDEDVVTDVDDDSDEDKAATVYKKTKLRYTYHSLFLPDHVH